MSELGPAIMASVAATLGATGLGVATRAVASDAGRYARRMGATVLLAGAAALGGFAWTLAGMA